MNTTQIQDMLKEKEQQLLDSLVTSHPNLSHGTQARYLEFIALLGEAMKTSDSADIRTPGWSGMRDFLETLALEGREQGLSASESANVVWSLKRSLMSVLRVTSNALGHAELWAIADTLDRLALYTTEVHLTSPSRKAADEILAIVSHDLRNPLAAIMLQSKLILKSHEQDPMVRDLPGKIAKITRCCERMNRLIEDLLDVSSIEEGKFKVVPKSFCPLGLARDTISTFEEIAAHNKIELRFDGEDPKTEVRGDRERLLQVLANLLSNAVKFTPEGGEIQLRLEQNPQETVFTVQDSGTGIPHEALPHIFNRFWQGRNRTGGGVGLGLSIVKGIVDAHKGQVTVASEPGRGTTFSFSLPH